MDTHRMSGAPKILFDVLGGLRKQFFTAAEFPLLPDGQLPIGVLARGLGLEGDALRRYAVSLKGKDLDGLLLELRKPLNEEQARLALDILNLRKTQRLMGLLTAVYQYYFDLPSLDFVLKGLNLRAEAENDVSEAARFIRRFGGVIDKLAAICTAIDEYNSSISSCFGAFSIADNSPLAKAAALSYLKQADRKGMEKNRRWLLSVIEAVDASQLQPLITRYLGTFAIEEFHDSVNIAILEKLGQPYISPDWAPYEIPLRDKFTQWCFLHQLRLHTIGSPQKFAVLSKYSCQVRGSRIIEGEALMIIDFGEIAVADLAGRTYSFFYEKEVLEEELALWQESRSKDEKVLGIGDPSPAQAQPSFIRLEKKSPSARDFMIEEIEACFVKLSYEGIDILYIQDMLDIKTGLEPDLRRSKLEKIKKRPEQRM